MMSSLWCKLDRGNTTCHETQTQKLTNLKFSLMEDRASIFQPWIYIYIYGLEKFRGDYYSKYKEKIWSYMQIETHCTYFMDFPAINLEDITKTILNLMQKKGIKRTLPSASHIHEPHCNCYRREHQEVC